MSTSERSLMRLNRGVGLIEVMISIIIAMLLVLVIYQVYEISEGQKRTITAGSDAQQNASFGLYALGRDLAMAGNGIASAADKLKDCSFDLPLPPGLSAPHPLQSLRPMPVVIEHFDDADVPDKITVFYGGSGSLSTPVQFQTPQATTADPYIVRAPVGFNANDVVAAVDGARCTLSKVNVVGVDGNGYATLTRTPIPGVVDVAYGAPTAALINLGQLPSIGRITYTVDTQTRTLRTQNQFSNDMQATTTPAPVINDVVNLKAQYGLDTDNNGDIDAWQDATDGSIWSAANLPNQPLATLRQIRAVRIAIVTRSAQYEKEEVTTGPLSILDDTVSMPLSADDKHYRYKILETVVPLRNALWNAP